MPVWWDAVQHVLNRLFNSPPDQDDISRVKSKFDLSLIFLCGCIWAVVIASISYKNSQNRFFFYENRIENQISVPQIFFIFVNVDITSVTIYYQQGSNSTIPPFHCEKNINTSNYDCINEYNLDYRIDNSTFIILPNQYFNISYTGQEDWLFVFNSKPLDLIGGKLYGGNIWLGDSITFVNLELKSTMYLQKQVLLLKNGTEQVDYLPYYVNSPKLVKGICVDPISYNVTLDCIETRLAMGYQSNIVQYTIEESNSSLTLRTLANIFSIGKLSTFIFTFIFMRLTYLYLKNRLFGGDPSAWYPNIIRNTVLYHIYNYKIPQELQELSMTDGAKLTKIQQLQLSTEGSDSKFERLLQSASANDHFSPIITRITAIKWLSIFIIFIIVGVFVGRKDYENRLITSDLVDQEEIDLPTLSILTNDKVSWFGYDETIGLGKMNCTLNLDFQSYSCVDNGQIQSSTFLSNGNVTIPPNSVYMKKGQVFHIKVVMAYPEPALQYIDWDYNVNILMNGNLYNVNSFSNVTVTLSKSIYYYADSEKEPIVNYDPSFYIFPTVMQTLVVDNVTFRTGILDISFLYPVQSVKTTYEETNTQLYIRIVTDGFSYLSPIITFVSIIVSYFVIKFHFRNPSVHGDLDTRDAIIYHMRHHEKYIKTG
ncbi:hypothetical protein DLAC_01019 [Tieghemostelium lacteum]|uniref:Transmembrane protein n=1 Tax=Tieghemostelium lacteum TaxID=361077 RepID=A0A152A7I3_TIELA|nr:hypothetical protein DLAC_01019 [Tieghemostelium lacteum]|eukprot:KYR02200.1 hypothetical protein DLAC_01019 [Tieghemostelium lacteum]